ncbi:hypothetical protein SD457_08725 [Coprobacillaceae bacterium CR2/5/TPMF4]|nr:hypothetical protein SD457_08725 [Coprobacillaceae bacterium CR2/5/TPMF4]
MNEELSDEQLEYYQSQLDEINSLDLDTIDEDSLDYEKKQLQEYEKIKEKLIIIANILMVNTVF